MRPGWQHLVGELHRIGLACRLSALPPGLVGERSGHVTPQSSAVDNEHDTNQHNMDTPHCQAHTNMHSYLSENELVRVLDLVCLSPVHVAAGPDERLRTRGAKHAQTDESPRHIPHDLTAQEIEMVSEDAVTEGVASHTDRVQGPASWPITPAKPSRPGTALSTSFGYNGAFLMADFALRNLHCLG